MVKVKLRAIGNSVGVVFPKELLAKYNLVEGDSVHVVETSDGFVMTPLPNDVEEQLRHGRELMKQYRETFAALAK
jgi:putative addiction module antidote